MILPEQYRTGIAYFMDFDLKVSRDTFIPRPETEILVERVVEGAHSLAGTDGVLNWNSPCQMFILDVGTGSGNIAISLTKYLRHSKIIALDISHEALVNARENACYMGVSERICFAQSDMFSALTRSQVFDIIVCNPPYISERDMADLPPEVKAEPYTALFGGHDGLDFYRRISLEACYYLRKGGLVLMEMGYDQSECVRQMLETAGYVEVEVFKDYAGIERVIKARVG